MKTMLTLAAGGLFGASLLSLLGGKNHVVPLVQLLPLASTFKEYKE